MRRGDPDFLSRWSSRKLKRQKPEEEAAPNLEFEHNFEDGEPDAEKDYALLQELGLKAPEDVSPGEELAAFLKAAIPAHLKRRALRTLWASNPVLANLDGLNDYDGDFTGGCVPQGQLKTSFQIGKGFADAVFDRQDMAAAAEPPAQEASSDDAETRQHDDPAEVETDVAEAVEPGADDGAATRGIPSRNRMSFRFDRET